MDCAKAEKNINSFIRGTLSGNELRRTYYHLKKCDKCSEVLLDEFSFYMTFNDLDQDLNFNYKKNLSEFMEKIEKKIILRDTSLKKYYFFYSVLICVLMFAILVVALRVVY